MNLEQQFRSLADTVIRSETKNIINGSVLTNAELHDYVMGSDSGIFSGDIFDPVDFRAILDTGNSKQCEDAMYVSILKYNVFRAAVLNNIGDAKVNTSAASEYEYWTHRLADRLHNLNTGKERKAKWLN